MVRQPPPDDPEWIAWEEEAVEQAAARFLIPLPRLLRAMRRHREPDAMAEALRVDRPMLDARLRGLHPSEWARLHEARQHHGGAPSAHSPGL